MNDLRCWICRGEALPREEGFARFGLCSDHLRERVRAVMVGEPKAAKNVTPIRKAAK